MACKYEGNEKDCAIQSCTVVKSAHFCFPLHPPSVVVPTYFFYRPTALARGKEEEENPRLIQRGKHRENANKGQWNAKGFASKPLLLCC